MLLWGTALQKPRAWEKMVRALVFNLTGRRGDMTHRWRDTLLLYSHKTLPQL